MFHVWKFDSSKSSSKSSYGHTMYIIPGPPGHIGMWGELFGSLVNPVPNTLTFPHHIFVIPEPLNTTGSLRSWPVGTGPAAGTIPLDFGRNISKTCSIRLRSITASPPNNFQTFLRPCRAADPVFPPSLLLLPWLETQFFTFSVNGQDYSVFIAAWNQEKHLQLFSLLRNEQCISNSLKATTGCALCRAKI